VTRAGFETSNSPEYYIQFILRSTLVINGDTATFNGTVTPLCTYTTCTERNELPPPFPALETTIAADGTFTSGFAGQMPALSNPFTGTVQPLDAVAAGTIYSPDFFCGSVTGPSAGLDLIGSTFAAWRITDTTPANLPVCGAACPEGGQDAGVDAPPVDAAVDAPTEAPTHAPDDAPPAA
jgi:hypothetical protein